MPTFKGIAVHLKSQHGICTLREYAPNPSTAASDSSTSLVLKDASTVSVFVPLYPSSQFWISYKVNTAEVLSTYFYFKLFIDGAHIVSWGVGEQNQYRGKTMYALFEPEKGAKQDKYDASKRSFFFPGKDRKAPLAIAESNYGTIEVKCYRSNTRKRLGQDVALSHCKRNTLTTGPKQGISLRHANYTTTAPPNTPGTGSKSAKSYEYALSDPPESPWVSFRYYYRDIDDLANLDLLAATPSPSLDTLMRQSSISSSFTFSSEGEPLANEPASRFQEQCSPYGEYTSNKEAEASVNSNDSPSSLSGDESQGPGRSHEDHGSEYTTTKPRRMDLRGRLLSKSGLTAPEHADRKLPPKPKRHDRIGLLKSMVTSTKRRNSEGTLLVDEQSRLTRESGN